MESKMISKNHISSSEELFPKDFRGRSSKFLVDHLTWYSLGDTGGNLKENIKVDKVNLILIISLIDQN